MEDRRGAVMSDNGNAYHFFLERKSQLAMNAGFEPLWMPDFLFDFQKALVELAIRKGRAAIFADCGLGKTPMQLVWAENVIRKTNKPVLILTPLAVSYQTHGEAAKFGIYAELAKDGHARNGITITNYEQLHKFDPGDFAGAVCDESSILKSFDGVRRAEVTKFMRKLPYRLLCTATAAPNDYIELGTSSEALGYLGHVDMLHRFFKKDDKSHAWMGGAGRRYLYGGECWRFKGHAELPFWKWVCSWARACRKPSDLGFANDGFILPPLTEDYHLVDVEQLADGMLFALPAIGLREQRDERRRSINERCEKIASLIAETHKPALVWCHLNSEADLLERLTPDGLQVSGQDSEEVKEERFIAFTKGQLRVLICKPKIGAWGMNFQHCAHVVSFPSHSYEQYYQGIRRCWRFGQTHPVQVDIVMTEGEQTVLTNLTRKAQSADRMFSDLVACMNDAIAVDKDHAYTELEECPAWL